MLVFALQTLWSASGGICTLVYGYLGLPDTPFLSSLEGLAIGLAWGQTCCVIQAIHTLRRLLTSAGTLLQWHSGEHGLFGSPRGTAELWDAQRSSVGLGTI